MLSADLINNHKSVHGDAPSRAGEWRPRGPVPARGRGHRAQISAPFPGQTRLYGPAPAGHWRKKYSLNNKPAATAVPTDPAQRPGPPSLGSLSNKPSATAVPADPAQRTGPSSLGSLSNKSPAPTTTHSSQSPASKSSAPPSLVRRSQASCPTVVGGPRPSPSLPPGSQQAGPSHAAGGRAVPGLRVGRGRGVWGGKGAVAAPVGAGEGGVPGAVGDGRVGGAGALPAERSLGQRRRSLATRVGADSALQLKPRLQRRVDSAPKLAATPAVPFSSPPLPLSPSPPPHSRSLPRTVATPVAKGGVDKQRLLPSPSKSQFTWVKDSQGALSSAPSPAVSVAPPPPSSARKTHRRPGSVAKTTKYTWVSSSSATRLPRKPLSPKALDTPQRAAVGGGARKLKSAVTHAAKNRKGAGPAGSSQAHSSSRYRWKAIGQGPTGVARGVARGGSRGVARGGSVYRWTSEKENGPKRGSGPSPTPPRAGHAPAATSTPTSPSPSPAGFKLRSRMKIIRRRSLSR